MNGARIRVALLALATVAAAPQGLPERLRAVAATYYARAAQVATITNRYSAMDYYQRLIDDAGTLSDPASQRSRFSCRSQKRKRNSISASRSNF